MDLIILNDGLYQLVPVTKQMMEHMSLLVDEIDLFELCDILRLKLTRVICKIKYWVQIKAGPPAAIKI